MNEMLPAARSNPGALRGYQVFALIKGRYRAVDPRFINWRTVDMRKIQIRQPPGERNALGKIKFMFPNAYSVYLHDTPSKSLFQRDYRAYSHGCMRVMEPMEFADALLSEEVDLNAAYLKKLFGGSEKRVNLTKKVPVHITYFTAWVGESGALETRDDLYGHDAHIENALGSS
jgi:murein L,D-transpeptidase YcbB/YkuD